MAHRDRKIRKMRGSRTCGFGNTQKHRGAGSRGGRGMAGGKKHKWMSVSKNMPGYFGKKGFTKPNQKTIKTVNVGYINDCIDGWVEKGLAVKEKKGYSLNLKESGYDKLLGAGNITKPISITVEECSTKARKKIEDVGGKITVTKPKPAEVVESAEEVESTKSGVVGSEPTEDTESLKEVSDETGVPETTD